MSPRNLKERDLVFWYKVPYSAGDYTFPKDALIHSVRFDEKYIQLELTDERILSIPLWWIPSLYNADPAEREKYDLSQDRRMLVWDPDVCAINDELRIDDYLVPRIVEPDDQRTT